MGQTLSDSELSLTRVARAFATARQAQPGWADRPPGERSEPFLALADLLLERRESVLDVLQDETGKARANALEELLDAVLSISWYARNAARLLRPRRRPGPLPVLSQTREYARPVGVVTVITPWNYPLALAADVVPALLAGNAVVHKPDGQTSRSSLLLREYAVEAGLPPQVWQPVFGTASQIGDAVVDGADFVSFTGSTAAGRRIAERAARRLIGCSLELGGKNPMIILDDADLDRVVPAAVRACFGNAGQLCIGIERIYVQRSIEPEFLRRFVTATRMLRLGTGRGYTADVGSLISADQLDRVRGMVDRAVAEGAQIAAGGRAEPSAGPYVYEPTILTGAAPDSEIVREEVFGPVVTVQPFDTDDEAVGLANDSRYGLNASVFGRNARRARSVAGRLEAGMVNINEGYGTGYGSAAPVGGWKQSGTGRRHGRQGLLQFTRSQIIAQQRLIGFDPVAGLSSERYGNLLVTGVKALRRLRIR
ncbi:succinic semialdehyde dehydrogenase [Microlunatus sp. Gsoil 973]|uniref:succinic semialdehyde dehydrogenase n=1 Tax=Microlunatus sp. Gsoil 973 TaxID=2672569 RepID=UPI0012B45D57|nr:succinic semialdehyde dehydrogenase [Microlunatus sp. Gsoil 973]QGN33397.1 aldehyde dehydrogenase family protein [Microlunatus sp. Gsoil 973]